MAARVESDGVADQTGQAIAVRQSDARGLKATDPGHGARQMQAGRMVKREAISATGSRL